MSESNRNESSRKYAKISLETREKLIHLIENEKTTFIKAGEILGINQSTARMIYRKYEKKGILFEKKDEKATRLEVEKALENYLNQNKIIPSSKNETFTLQNIVLPVILPISQTVKKEESE